MAVYIYALHCPVAGLPRYIGKTRNPATRLSAHLAKARTHQTAHHCSDWIRSLLRDGLRPTLDVLFEVPEGEAWQDHEKRVIADYRVKGFPLTNLTGGGEGFYQPNTELLERRGKALSAVFSTPEMRRRREAIAAEVGARPEVRAKRAIGVSGAWADPEKRARMLEGMRTLEARARRAAATRARNADPELAAQHTAKMKAMFADPARKEQLGRAREKRWRDHRAAKNGCN